MNDTHLFKVEDAKNYGVECATILYNLRYWLDKNKANEKHIHDGRVWTYNSAKAFSDLFPYLSERQIYRRLKALEEKGAIVTGNYNEHKYDQTRWYSVDEIEYCISENENQHLPKSENGNSESVEPIPDINTDSNTDSNSVSTVVHDVPNYSDSDTWQASSRIANHLLESICEYDSTHKYNTNQPSLSGWVKDIDRALRLDGRTEEQMNFIIDYIYRSNGKHSSFWAGNIESGAKLRSQFDKIKLQIKSERNGHRKENSQLIDGLYPTN